jgi:hypothetical protein
MSSHLRLGLSSVLVFSGFPTVCTATHPIRATFPAHLSLVGTFTYVTLNIYGYVRSLCAVFVLMVLCGMNLFHDIDSLNLWTKSGHNPYMWPVVTWHHQIRHYCLETAQVTVCATVQLLWRRQITGVWHAIYWCVVCGTVSRRDMFVKPHPTALLWLTALTVWGSALIGGY